MTADERDRFIRSQPLGICRGVKPDGTVLVEFDVTNPLAAKLVITGLTQGIPAANELLRREQAKDTN